MTVQEDNFLVENFGRERHFSVPNDYFAQFHKQMMEQVRAEAAEDDSPANVESFTPVDGVTLYAVTASSSVILYPFRAYATDAVVVDPIDPIDPIEITVTSAGVATAYLPYDALVPDVDFFVVLDFAQCGA